jgi:epidermal growth factor receptor substrate 15
MSLLLAVLQMEAAPNSLSAQPPLADDPILKSLTGMGYSRADAVAALEQYDYNLDKVSNMSSNCCSSGGE